MKIHYDAFKTTPMGYTGVSTLDEFTNLVKANNGNIEIISLDYEHGGKEALEWLDGNAQYNTLLPVPYVFCHHVDLANTLEMTKIKHLIWRHWECHGYNYSEWIQKEFKKIIIWDS